MFLYLKFFNDDLKIWINVFSFHSCNFKLTSFIFILQYYYFFSRKKKMKKYLEESGLKILLEMLFNSKVKKHSHCHFPFPVKVVFPLLDNECWKGNFKFQMLRKVLKLVNFKGLDTLAQNFKWIFTQFYFFEFSFQ